VLEAVPRRAPDQSRPDRANLPFKYRCPEQAATDEYLFSEELGLGLYVGTCLTAQLSGEYLVPVTLFTIDG
jgi:hypothetical protein